ncbi:MAG: hypothetical protein KDD70_10330 [Bdellovibrionales bacterium]|nr:hypothetical protein [Bdellovibrionales bacterium]
MSKKPSYNTVMLHLIGAVTNYLENNDVWTALADKSEKDPPVSHHSLAQAILNILPFRGVMGGRIKMCANNIQFSPPIRYVGPSIKN